MTVETCNDSINSILLNYRSIHMDWAMRDTRKTMQMSGFSLPFCIIKYFLFFLLNAAVLKQLLLQLPQQQLL